MSKRARVLAPLAGATVVAVWAAPAAAHVSPQPQEVVADSYTAVTFTVPHGCDGSPTTSLEIQIPEAILDVTPAIVPGWDVDITTEPLAEPVEGPHGESITERESVVTYAAQPGNELPDGFRTSFTIGFRAPDAAGEELVFPAVQGCVEGETAWIELHSGEGEEPDYPAPVVQVVAASDGGDAGHGSDEATDEATDEAADDATDDADVDADVDAVPAASTDDGDDDSSTGLAVAGLVAGLVGAGLGGTALVTSRRR